MPENIKAVGRKQFSLAFLDLGGIHIYQVDNVPGDWQVTEAGQGFSPVLVRNNGFMRNTIRGDETPLTWGFTANFREAGGVNDAATLADVVAWRQGSYVDSTWISTAPLCSGYNFADHEVTVDGMSFGGFNRTLVIPDSFADSHQLQQADPASQVVSGSARTASQYHIL